MNPNIFNTANPIIPLNFNTEIESVLFIKSAIIGYIAIAYVHLKGTTIYGKLLKKNFSAPISELSSNF